MKSETAGFAIGKERTFSSTRRLAAPTALLKTLAEARLALVRLAREAQEQDDRAAAKDLKAKAEALKPEIARLRRAVHKEWPRGAGVTQTQLTRAAARLFKTIQDSEKATSLPARALRIASAVTVFIGAARRWRL